MAICFIHNMVDSSCPCSDNYKVGQSLQTKLDGLNLSVLAFYELMANEKYFEKDDKLVEFFTKHNETIMFNEAHVKLGFIVNKYKVNVISLLKDYEESKKSNMPTLDEIVHPDELENGQKYLAYGTSMGDGHLSDIDYDTWRRVKFENGRFHVIEKEDSSRGYFKVKRAFKMPQISEGDC
jgi:hypothetical protein